MLKMSVQTSESSTEQSLSTWPGILSGALRGLILITDLRTLFLANSTLSPGGGLYFYAEVLLSF